MSDTAHDEARRRAGNAKMNAYLRGKPEQPRGDDGKFQSLDQGPRGGTGGAPGDMNRLLRELAAR